MSNCIENTVGHTIHFYIVQFLKDGTRDSPRLLSDAPLFYLSYKKLIISNLNHAKMKKMNYALDNMREQK